MLILCKLTDRKHVHNWKVDITYIITGTGNDFSSFGSLRIKGYNKTVGGWRCTPTGVPDTTERSSDEETNDSQGV